MTERFVTRGFVGRRAPARTQVDVATRIPPGQYLTTDFPVLSAGPTPRTPLDRWSFSIDGLVREPVTWTWDEFTGAARPRVGRRHQLRHEVDEARHALARRERRHLARARRARARRPRSSSPVATAATRRTCRSRTSSTARRSSPGSTTASRSRPSTAGRPDSSSPAATSGRARSGCAASGSRRRTSRVSGSRSATTTAATSGSKSATAATEGSAPWQPDRVAARDGHRASATRRRRSGHSRSALPTWPGHRPGQHVDLRLTAEDGYSVERSYSIASEPERGRRDRPDGRADRRRRGVALPPRRRRRRRPSRGARARSAATSCGRRSLGGPLLLIAGGSGVVPLMAMAPASATGRLGRSDPPALQLAPRRGDHLSRGARRARRGRTTASR